MFKLAVVAAGAALILAAAPAARADITFNLNATATTTGGSPAGTVFGSFTTNDARSAVLVYNITASAAGNFLGFTYTPPTATISSQSLPSQFFRLDSPGNVNELQLYFAAGLGTDGGTLLASNSYENEPSGGNRFLSGTVTVAAAPAAVPEPASLLLLGIGVAGLGAIRRRRA